MPFKGRTTRRRRTVRRRPASAGIRTIVKKAIARSKETKHVCITSLTGQTVNSAGIQLSTFTPPQGDGGRSRDGDFVTATYLSLKYILQADPTDNQNVMRVMVVQSKKGLLTPFDGPGWFKCISDEMRASYRVLYDRTHIMNADNGTEATWTGPFYSRTSAKQMRVLEWKPSTTTNTEPNVKGAVYIWVFSSSQIAPSPTILYDYKMSWQEK